jgi:hypothetical protein
MPRTLIVTVTVALALAASSPLACSPQIVDAVEPSPDAGPTCPDGGSGADRDGDGVPDCADRCPTDSAKTVEGQCGCGLLDPTMVAEGEPTCLDLAALLSHRYTFDGTGTTLVDTSSGADGIVKGTQLTGTGRLTLAGLMNDQYAEMPNRIINRLVANPELAGITFEAWLQWSGGPSWQRIFDFGNNNGPGGNEQGPNGTSYLFLTTRTPQDSVVMPPQPGRIRLAYKRPGGDEAEVTLDATIAMPTGSEMPTQVVAVVDFVSKTMSLYVDGRAVNDVAHFRNPDEVSPTSIEGAYDWSAPVMNSAGAMVLPPGIDLSLIDDSNNWLGRSQFEADNELQGTFYEFRIYAGALAPELIEMSRQAGPDAVFLP